MNKSSFSGLSLPVLALLIAFTTGCKADVPQIHLESPEANISPVLIGVASVFMKIVNTGGGDDVLLGARAIVPGTITELHDIQDGKMVKVESIAIPGDGTVVLRPARFHIMIFNLPKDAREGYPLNLILAFKQSGEKMISLQLRTFAPGRRAHN